MVPAFAEGGGGGVEGVGAVATACETPGGLWSLQEICENLENKILNLIFICLKKLFYNISWW